MDAFELLRKVPFLAAAADQSLSALVQRGRWRPFTRGEFLFHLGEPAERLYVIADGRVAATLSSSQGTPVLFHVASVGETPGQVDLLRGDVYTASAQALSAGTAFVVPARSCRDLLAAEPSCLMRFAADLAEIVTVLTDSMADLVFLDLERRLGRLLADMPSVGDRIDLTLTQSELAARLGVARQSLNRALAKLAERGFVIVESPRVVHVIDRLALMAFIDSGSR